VLRGDTCSAHALRAPRARAPLQPPTAVACMLLPRVRARCAAAARVPPTNHPTAGGPSRGHARSSQRGAARRTQGQHGPRRQHGRAWVRCHSPCDECFLRADHTHTRTHAHTRTHTHTHTHTRTHAHTHTHTRAHVHTHTHTHTRTHTHMRQVWRSRRRRRALLWRAAGAALGPGAAAARGHPFGAHPREPGPPDQQRGAALQVRVHARACVRVCCAQALARTRTHTCKHSRVMHKRSHTHTHTRAHSRAYDCLCACACARACASARTGVGALHARARGPGPTRRGDRLRWRGCWRRRVRRGAGHAAAMATQRLV
jgi:hypothetical protein